MKLRFHRVLVALSALCGTFVALNQIEKSRATMSPPGWTLLHGEALNPEEGPPRIGTSVWRIGPNTAWQANEEAKQLYLRPQLTGTLGVSLTASTINQGLWLWLHPDKPATTMLDGTPLECMGQLTPSPEVEPLELNKQQEGTLIRWGEQRMVCPGTPSTGRPSIQTTASPISLVSIGRDRRSDGVPLSPLWWMSGMMVGGLLGMVLLDLLLALRRKFQQHAQIPQEE